MRKEIDLQMKIGETDISKIRSDLRSRDEIPKLLMGLQYIYCNSGIREQVFNILKGIIPEGTDVNNGRPGMELWKILISGTLRLNCNRDYDKIKEIADNHIRVREMMGHCGFGESFYPLQTIKDDVSLFTPEIPDKINQIVVKAGHNLVRKKEEGVRGKCDSFAVGTDVHFPTDINLLYDAIRKMIKLIGILCSGCGMSAWRQSHKNILKIRRLYNHIRCMRHSTSRDAKKKEERKGEIINAHEEYIISAREYVEKTKSSPELLYNIMGVDEASLREVVRYMNHAERQTDQIGRRVIRGENIPHSEKVFSVFEEHTERISKGKAGVLQEPGMRVCIIEDQYRFVPHHRVMSKETDDKVAIVMVREVKEKFGCLRSCSFDKGFYSRFDREESEKILGIAVLPKKGKLSSEEKETEASEYSVRLRHEHSGVGSAINASENHSSDRCPDHGKDGFLRYAAFAVPARNLQVSGNIVRQKELKRQKRIGKYDMTWDENRGADRLAA